MPVLVLFQFDCPLLFHWVQSKRHRLWFFPKTCICYSTKAHINSVILILKLILTSLRNIYIKMCVVLNEDHFYFSQRSQIQFEDEDHAVDMSFRWVTTTLSSLRTTTCDALIVPSGFRLSLIFVMFNGACHLKDM